MGTFGILSFSPKLADIFQRAVAQNEGEDGTILSLTQEENTEEISTEANENVLTLEDTTYAISAGAEEENYSSLSSVEEVDDLTDTNYAIRTTADWVKLQKFSQSSSLSGKVFYLYWPENSSSAETWSLTSEQIGTGIGSDEYPFAGTLVPYAYPMTIQTTGTLFYSLSSKAVIGNKNHKNSGNSFTIVNAIAGSTSNEGGLAKNYIIEDENVNLADRFYTIKITGSIQSTGTVGGLFGKVTKADTIITSTITLSENIDIDLSGVTEFKGSVAGGLFGEVSGSIIMNLESMPSVATKVVADDPASNNGTEPLTLTVCAGGLIGKMSDDSKLVSTAGIDESTTPEYLVIGNDVGGEGISGGLVGVVYNSEVNVSYIQKNSVKITEGAYEPYISAKYICGGFIGLVQSSKVELAHLKLNADVKAYYSEDASRYTAYTAAGGVVGRYYTEAGDTESYLKISYITTENDERPDNEYGDLTQKVMVYSHSGFDTYNTGGGIIGACNGNGMTIQHVKFDNESYNVSLVYAVSKTSVNLVSNTSNESVTGAVAGSLSGLDITISDVTFNFVCNTKNNGVYSNSLGGYYVGNIAGLVGSDRGENIPTKIKISNIIVENNYIHKAKKYHGGLFGYVKKGALICLADTIDISKVPFQHSYSGYDGDWSKKDCVLLAPEEIYGGYRGFIAGYAENSLIYFECDAKISRSIKYDENGKLVSNMDGVEFDADNGALHRYCIDDIGNAGSVLQNVKRENGSKVIEYDACTYGNEVTGSLTYSDGKYKISSLADALILAIAGQTYDEDTGELVFAKNCFQTDDSNIKAILSAHYVVTTDLNLGDANIHSFLRNDSSFSFSGSMEGEKSDANPVIILNSVSRHTDGGLYPALADGSVFKNLTFDGKMWYHRGVYDTSTSNSKGGSGSIAARAEGSCNFRGITINTSIKGDMYENITAEYVNGAYISDRMYSHGGLIGEYQLNEGTLTVDECNFSPVITCIRSSSFVGGMIGRVETSLDSAGNYGSINVSNSTVGTEITADATNYMIGMTSSINKAHVRTAGLISFIGNSYNNVDRIKNSTNSYPSSIEDKTYANINLSNITIKSALIDLTKAKNEYVNMSGGLLGYAWCNVEATMENITVEDCEINSLGSVGGLITFIAGKFDVRTIDLKSLSMNCVDCDYGVGRSYSGLLFGNGEFAYVTLDQSKYTIATVTDDTDAPVKITGYSQYFDEIVGINVKRNFNTIYNSKFFEQEIEEEYKNGGILNIINSSFNGFDTATYESYTNKVCTTSNKYTRYYYNLFQGADWNFDTVKNSVTITTPKQLMTWHVGSYADEKLTRFFVPYFNNVSDYRSKIMYVDITGTFDMAGYSLYPTCISGAVIIKGENARIKLYGEEISDLEYGLYSSEESKIYRNNELKRKYTNVQSKEECTQHYLMHSSLLYCINTSSASANISGLTISGTIANNGAKTGSLIGGYAVGTINISDIVFDGLRVSHYDALTGEYSVCGLMLGTVGVKNYADIATNVEIKGIKTTDTYADSTNKPVAGALITRVGSSSAKNIQISFEDMQLDSKISSNIFKYAAFMYSFNYSSDSKDNKSYGIYTFDYIDTVDGSGPNNVGDDNNVTYGKEIAEGIHYNDKYLNEIVDGYANPLKQAIDEAKVPTYVPYVYENMGIFVNPKNGNITEGCGTYEDPYIIKNPAQLLTLFCYLSGEHEVYRSFLKPGENEEAAWKVVPIGGDGNGYQCTSSDNHTPVTYETDDFPTVDDMRTAYYMITDNIDLANTGDANYTMLLKRFAGLGSYKYPFSGVIVGKKITVDGAETFPTITLPSNDSTNYAHFGLIEYMQGAVVKDINIENTKVTVTGSVGGVAAVILGGDNIIDNVTVGIKATLRTASAAGGYVGIIENGSLILRNVKGNNVVNYCEFGLYTDDGVSSYYTSSDTTKTLISDDNMKVGLLVGKVEDGFVLYDNLNEFDSDTKIITIDNMPVTTGRTEQIPLVNGFQIINGCSLDEASGNKYSDRIAVETQSSDGTITGFDFNIYNTEQLEILALALNSDSLSVYVDESYSVPDLRTAHDSGYDYTAKCRKATYADVGTAEAKGGNSADCTFAKAYDDGRVEETLGYLYPYLCYKYMCVTDSKKVGHDYTDEVRYTNFKTTILSAGGDDGSKKYISVLNKADDNVSQYTTSYKLRASTSYLYDLSVYENSFRGFGALYSKQYSDFRANFDGKGHSVKINMDRNWDANISITGMFNSLIYDTRKDTNGTSDSKLEIIDFTLVDSVFQNRLNQENLSSVNETEKLKGAACGSATGAVAGEVQGAWEFKSIIFKRSDSASFTSFQGLLLYALSDEEFQREMVCGVRGYMNVGGLIGRINTTDYIEGTVSASADCVKYGDEATHGGSNSIEIIGCSIEGYDEKNAVNIQGGTDAFAVGGLVGSIGANLNTYAYNTDKTRCFYFGEINFKDCSVKNANILAKNSGFLGGFAGTVGYRPDYYWRSAGVVNVKYSSQNNVINQVNILFTEASNEVDKYSAGGVFGQIEVFPVKSLACDNEKRYLRNSEIGTEDASCTMKNVYVSSLTINNRSSNVDSKDSTKYNIQGNTGGIGGLIGYLSCRKMSIKRVQVTDSKIGYNNMGTDDTTDDQYALTHVGGLIGISSSNGEYENKKEKSFYTNMLQISGAKVSDSLVVTKQQEAAAGGFIGYLSTENVTITNTSDEGWETLLITNNEISADGTSGNAGGVIGKVEPSKYVPYNDSGASDNTLIVKKYIEHLDIAGNTITSKATSGDAGGVVGEFTSDLNNSYESRLTLEAVQVGGQEVSDTEDVSSTSNTIIGYEYTGGLCGYVKGMTYLRYKDYVRVGSETSGNTLIGRVTGGLYGKLAEGSGSAKSGIRELFETDQVEIINNKIIAVSDSNPYTVSGGVAGVRIYHKALTYVATYTIKNNVIIASGNIGSKYYKNISCGGMYGQLKYISSDTAHYYVQYFDNMVLENNSIGYYRVLSDKNIKTMEDAIEYFTSSGTKLDYTTQEVCLFKWKDSSSFVYDNWRNYEINESNVGEYACRIGNYIGDYSNAAMHCVFLRPTLTYSEDVGSIPAVDVASTSYNVTVTSSDYGYSYPYDYKYKCHFIYLDDYKSSDAIVDITDSEEKPVLDESVLMQHGENETTDEDGNETTVPVYETDYFFGNIANIVSEYSEVKNTTLSEEASSDEKATSTYKFLTSKRLDITMGGTNDKNLICASPDSVDYFSKTYTASGTYNGVPVIEMDGQAAQYIGDYVAAILTNGGGVYPEYSSSTFNSLLDISCVNAYIDPDGKIYAIGDDGKVAGIEGTTHAESSITTVDTNKLSAEGRPFDQIIETTDGKYYTITLLRYTYSAYDYLGKEKKETIYIPVFVTKKVTMNSYLSILSGEEYSLTEACTNGRKDDVVISHDSVYTIYSEFVYDAVRTEESFSDLKVEKSLKFEALGADKQYQDFYVQAGTKYTLVDVQTGKEYYYTVSESAVSEIPFSQFTDSEGNPYKQRNIGEDGITITEEEYMSIGYYGGVAGTDKFSGTSGLERFFIVVEPSGTDINVSYRISITTNAVDGNEANKEESIRKIESDGINITQIPGPLISFEGVKENNGDLEGTDGITWISGSIGKDKTLEVDGRIRVSMVPPNTTDTSRNGSPYWIYKAANKTIDSANAGKYLEIGVTLIDNGTNQEVQWPEGTNVIINGGTPTPLQGNSVIYTYKDNGQKFSFDTLSHNIANGEWYYYDISEGEEPNYQWITKSDGNNCYYYRQYDTNGNLVDTLTNITILDESDISVSNQCHLEFDFSVADIKDYVGKNYTVKINLYRSSDPDFPLEEAGTTVSDGSIREYYETILAEGNVDLAAAITPENLLDLGINLYGDTKKTYEIPFTNKIDFTDMISTKGADADIATCAARNYMVVYRIYKKTPKSGDSGYEYVLVDLYNDSPFTLYDISSGETPIPVSQLNQTNEDGTTTAKYAFVTIENFETDEIKAGVDSTPYVVTWQMKLTVDASKIEDADLANYKVEATYLPYDKTADQPTSDSESTLKDYFIFTIAKLKTDF